jgi:MFS family permease
MDSLEVELSVPVTPDIVLTGVSEVTPVPASETPPKLYKRAIRTSLKASTIDGFLATIFSITTGGILLSNFLVELGADSVAFGMMSSIPMLANLVQPLGAYFSEHIESRFHYSLWTYGPSRLSWFALLAGIVGASWGLIDNHQLVILTLGIVLFTHLLGNLGNASWLSWLAMIVPRRLRGRYFGLRNSVSSLTNLVCVPLAGLAVSRWPGGTIQGYGVILFVGILFGIASLGCQYFKIDINPKDHNSLSFRDRQKKNQTKDGSSVEPTAIVLPQEHHHSPTIVPASIWGDSNFWRFLLYFSIWMFSVNLSAPFFNLYLLGSLHLDVSWVTVYSSLQAGANLLMLIVWGKLADRIGNRPILLIAGILIAVIPLLWLSISGDHLDIWLWIPLLHILLGGTLAGVELCNNNLLLGVSPILNQSNYFAIAAALSGVSGALGTTIGGFLAQYTVLGGLLGLFAISSVFRFLALVPLIFVKEHR